MIKIAEVTKARPHMPEGARPSLKQKVFGLNGARVYGVDVPERRRGRYDRDAQAGLSENGGSDFLSEFTKPA